MSSVGALRQNSASFPVSAACAASSCAGAAPTPSAAKPPAPASSTTNAATAPQASRTSTTPATTPAPAEAADDDGGAAQNFNASGTLTIDQHTPNASSTYPLPSDDPGAQSLGLLAESGSMPSCPASSLGYQCSQKVADGVTIHYSYGGAGQPGNSCTQGAGLDATVGNNTAMMHLAIESTQPVRLPVGTA